MPHFAHHVASNKQSCPCAIGPPIASAEIKARPTAPLAVKEYLRRVCGYSFVELKANIPAALASVPIDQVQRYFQRAWRFQELYLFEFENGLELPAAVRDYAMNKYKRHRTVPATLLADVGKDLAAPQRKLAEMQSKGVGIKQTTSRLNHVNDVLSALKPALDAVAAGAAPMEL